MTYGLHQIDASYDLVLYYFSLAFEPLLDRNSTELKTERMQAETKGRMTCRKWSRVESNQALATFQHVGLLLNQVNYSSTLSLNLLKIHSYHCMCRGGLLAKRLNQCQNRTGEPKHKEQWLQLRRHAPESISQKCITIAYH